MPRKSVKENKNIYFRSREEAGMTRAQASEETYISESRIEKIEYGQIQITPQDVVAMAKAYKKPSLCNYYCSNDCDIGKNTVPELKMTELSQIVLSLLDSLNDLDSEKERLIEISADGEISPEELSDFVAIKKELQDISVSIHTLQLWIDNMLAQGKIRQDDYDSLNA